MRCLCICHRGNSRSVALAWILKDVLQMEAIAIGIHATTPETRDMLYDWADVIFALVPEAVQDILSRRETDIQSKLSFCHIPGDPYWRGYDAELLNTFGEYLYKTKFIPQHLYFDASMRYTDLALGASSTG